MEDLLQDNKTINHLNHNAYTQRWAKKKKKINNKDWSILERVESSIKNQYGNQGRQKSEYY